MSSSIQVVPYSSSGILGYIFSGVGANDINPKLTLVIGRTYTFTITSSINYPFWVKTVQSIGTGNSYSTGVVNNGSPSQNNIITFTPSSALQGQTLYYNCEFYPVMTNTINFIAPSQCPIANNTVSPTTALPTSTAPTSTNIYTHPQTHTHTHIHTLTRKQNISIQHLRIFLTLAFHSHMIVIYWFY